VDQIRRVDEIRRELAIQIIISIVIYSFKLFLWKEKYNVNELACSPIFSSQSGTWISRAVTVVEMFQSLLVEGSVVVISAGR
jgi:hypothetical protein